MTARMQKIGDCNLCSLCRQPVNKMPVMKFLVVLSLCLMPFWSPALLAEEESFPLVMAAGNLVAPIPGQMAIAAYISLENIGDEPVTLVEVRTGAAGKVTLHRTEVAQGMSRMTSVESLKIAPSEILEMQPGGLHLMLMDPVPAELESGHVAVEVILEDGRSQQFHLPVTSIREMPSHSHH